MQTTVQQLHEFGQSIWLDFIDRNFIKSGQLKELIEKDGVRGITSNPAIFEKAITNSSDYNEDIAAFADKPNDEVFFEIAVKDIQQSADLLKFVFDEEDGADGYVSLEVSPRLALDTEGSIKQARTLWKKLNRKNVMIKIPGTIQGSPAIQQCITEGININITLLFSLDRYKAVTEAYLKGLEERLERGEDISKVASVASFFLSRIDTLIDPILAAKGLNDLQGKTAIASAKLAYEIYKRVFTSSRWKRLEEKGAKTQRLLWASTSSKNPAFKDTKYVDALIGPHTINTVPIETLKAFLDHGKPSLSLEKDIDHATAVMGNIKTAGIDIDKITDQLETEGIEKFNQPFDKLLEAIDKQKKESRHHSHAHG